MGYRGTARDITEWVVAEEQAAMAHQRLFDAIDQGWLAPFQYFAIHDPTDYSRIRWTGIGYDEAELERGLVQLFLLVAARDGAANPGDVAGDRLAGGVFRQGFDDGRGILEDFWGNRSRSSLARISTRWAEGAADTTRRRSAASASDC